MAQMDTDEARLALHQLKQVRRDLKRFVDGAVVRAHGDYEAVKRMQADRDLWMERDTKHFELLESMWNLFLQFKAQTDKALGETTILDAEATKVVDAVKYAIGLRFGND